MKTEGAPVIQGEGEGGLSSSESILSSSLRLNSNSKQQSQALQNALQILANFCDYQSSSLFHHMAKVCEYGNHQFLLNKKHKGLYGLAPGGSCLPLCGSVEPLCLLHSCPSPSPRSSWPIIQKKKPFKLHWEAGYCQEMTSHITKYAKRVQCQAWLNTWLVVFNDVS